MLRATGAEIAHSGEDRAYEDLPRDRITLPDRRQFPTRPTHYQMALYD